MDQTDQLECRIRVLEAENARLRAEAGSVRFRGAGSAREDRYRALFDSIDEGFCVIEFLDGPHGALSDYVHIEANAAYAKHTGIQNVVGQKVRAMVPDEAEGWVELYRDVLVTGRPIRFERELVATGRYLELAAFRIEPASQRHVAVLFQDITARKRAEAALQHLTETLEARVAATLAERKVLADIVEGADALVQVVDTSFRWIAINGAASRQFLRHFGVRPKVGDDLLACLAPMPDARKALEATWSRALSGEAFVEISEHREPDGSCRSYEMRFNALRDVEGRQIGAYQFTYDVTERLAEQKQLRATEEALRQSQKMEAVGQLTGGIAHDFNNMLAVIMSSLRLAQRRLERGDASVQKYIGGALAGAQRAATLVSRLLSFSRQQPLSPQRTDANRLISSMEEVLRRAIPESILIELVRGGGLWSIHADPNGLENAVLNLVVNARDAMPDGGKLTIETANAHLDEAYAAAHTDVVAGQYVQIAVTDTGTGMTSDIIARAFEPFFTTKGAGAGTGLGLSQVYGFIKQSGGHIKIYSEPGVGTTVKLYIPRFADKRVTNPSPIAAFEEPPVGEGQLVLVVEDEEDVRRLTVDILVELGYAVVSSNDPLRALELLEQQPGIALLMTDVVMPVMNGRRLAEEAQRRRPDLRVLFTTGYTRNAIVHNGTLDEGVELLVKPFTMEAIAAKLAKLLRGMPAQ